ncbi:sulfotransferase family 2 domain-containing protein [Demequina sp. NBRC 110055]|uniref:sulfotransferase family 2 domain-containing protein n=1 Tax=Demequina sp. NBRC 110055 TaxID=1570344 RepID=UPI000A06C45B|nr:sulfotransferase family 2 domain-containing protein [Demequina sp. NBRC 110055]
MPIFRRDGVSILFVHIPKTGGSSVDDAFRDAGWSVALHDGGGGRDSLNRLRRCSPQHQHAAILESTLHVDRFDAIFTYVREPTRRVVSEYVWRARKAAQPDVSGTAVEAWVRDSFAKVATNPYWFDNHLRRQHEFLVPGTHTFRFEDGIETGLARLAAATGLDIPLSAPHRLKGSAMTGIDATDVVLTDAARDMVIDFYRSDYERLGYPIPVPVG